MISNLISFMSAGNVCENRLLGHRVFLELVQSTVLMHPLGLWDGHGRAKGMLWGGLWEGYGKA